MRNSQIQADLRMARRRKFLVYVATSADGFLARTDGSVDWLNTPRLKGSYGMGAFYRSIDTCVMGRKTYEHAVKFGMADGYAGKKNYIFSRTLKKAASAKVTIVREDVAAFAERLRGEKGQPIWLVGGAELIASFLAAGAVDEFILNVVPHMLGTGIPLIARPCDLPLKLVASRTFADGVVTLRYAIESTS
jgi:dihydrofolate reductase